LRVLFDALERSFEIAGEQYTIAKELYQGQNNSYVQCKHCNYESKNTGIYMDISLPIKNEFGTGVINSSLEMALENYLKPEILEGDN
jgi:ubiquitin C-terminal hydrolase